MWGGSPCPQISLPLSNTLRLVVVSTPLSNPLAAAGVSLPMSNPLPAAATVWGVLVERQEIEPDFNAAFMLIPLQTLKTRQERIVESKLS